MGWLRETRELALPRVVELPRVTDRISFLYLDKVAIHQDETGVIALSRTRQIRIPIAASLVLFCGPGTSITQPSSVDAGPSRDDGRMGR
jgi:CRISPR-associated protein Cas1